MTGCPHLVLDANFKDALLTPVGTDDGLAEENLLNATHEVISNSDFQTEEAAREDGDWFFPSFHDVMTAALISGVSKADFITWVSSIWDLNSDEWPDGSPPNYCDCHNDC